MVNLAQIVAIKKAIKEGKCKNPYAAINKVRKMENQYIEQRQKKAWYKFLSQ